MLLIHLNLKPGVTQIDRVAVAVGQTLRTMPARDESAALMEQLRRAKLHTALTEARGAAGGGGASARGACV